MLVPPERRAELSDIMAHLQRDERIEPLETRRVAKDGRVIDVSLRVSAIRNAAGEVTGGSSITRDITRQRLAETQARHSSRYFELARDMACTASLDGYFLTLNDVWTQTLGWSERELRARPFVEFVHPDDRDATERATATLRTGGVVASFVNRYETKQGDWRWLDWNAIAAVDEPLIYASARDVTERKRTEIALAASEHRVRQILESAHDAFVAIDGRGCITDWNPQAQTTFGWSRGEALGRELAETIIPERYRDAHRHGLERAVAGGEDHVLGATLQFPAVHRDGHEFPIELTISALRTEDGRSFYAFMRDITEREAAAVLLERQRRSLIEAQSVGQFGSWAWDVAADATEWSAELFRIYGLEPRDEPVTFEDFLAVVHPDDRAFVRAEIQAALVSGEPYSFEHRIVRPDGVVRFCEGRGEVIMGDDGVPLRMLGIGQDITKRREVERAKEEFISVISHELRTPLTSIRGSLGLLAGGVLTASPAKAQRMLQIALVSSDRLVRLINDLLDIERMQSGHDHLMRRPCDVGQLVHDAADTMRAAAAQAGITLHVSGGRGLVYADRDRMLQTLTNLLSNAIKFSPARSGVWLGSRAHDGEVIFRVRDHGRGIPPESLETIFGRFQQVDASDSREKGGTGLGLAICRRIVEQHGGRIWAESVVGQGSTFQFTLPTARTDLEAAADRRGTTSQSQILICDEDPRVREMLGDMLARRGYGVIAAASGPEAIDRALSEHPSAILLDIGTPAASGWDTALALSLSPETREIPVVILSVLSPGEAMPALVSVADWIEKPLDETSLFGALERAPAGQRQITRVLVVEPDPDLAKVLLALFERHGLEVAHAATGVDAVQLSRELQPDLLILDVALPDGDGFWVADWLRQHERLSSVPIVVYTSRELDASERTRLDSGHTCFMTKGGVTLDQFEHDVLKLVGALVPTAEAPG